MAIRQRSSPASTDSTISACGGRPSTLDGGRRGFSSRPASLEVPLEPVTIHRRSFDPPSLRVAPAPPPARRYSELRGGAGSLPHTLPEVPMRRTILVALALLTASCANAEGIRPPAGAPGVTATTPAVPGTSGSTTTSSPTTSSTAALFCPDPLLPTPPADGDEPRRIPVDDVVSAAITVSQTVFACAETVVVTHPGNPRRVAAAARLATEAGAPLLFATAVADPALAAELQRLAPATVLRVGHGAAVPAPPAIAVETVSVPTREPADPLPEVAGSGTGGVLWLVDEDAGPLAWAVEAAATASGGRAALVDGEDLRRSVETARAVREGPAVEHILLVGEMTDDADWQTRVILEADELPGGGFLMFEGTRIVLLYGNPLTPVLGALGEQGPEESVVRAREIGAPYAADGREVIPGFEIIATVADATPGPDGNYSNEMDPEVIRPWIEVAAREGVYVVLDLQPGRTDFLTQAKLYEEFLRLPHVGLALDPEWRLEPDQVHLVEIGTVGADEVNSVVEWLAGIVRDEGLPQKMLLLHQFRLAMLQDRERIEKPTELAVTIQMDGQGLIDDKIATWEAMTAGTEGAGWRWGWKNFYDEDSPTPTPDFVLDVKPTPVLVSYQ